MIQDGHSSDPVERLKAYELLNRIQLVPLIEWLVKTPVAGPARDNVVWNKIVAIARASYGNDIAFSMFCLAFEWNVSSTGETNAEPETLTITIKDHARMPRPMGRHAPQPLGGKLVLSKVKFNGDYSDSVAVDNQDNPRYIITLRFES